MWIEKAQFNGAALLLTTKDPTAARLAWEFKPGNYDLVKEKPKRSKNANAYMWELCDGIAKAVGWTKEAVYRKAIREVGVFEQILILEKAYKRHEETWQRNGVGWVCEIVDRGPQDWLTVNNYYGSSTYTTDEMSRLIENISEDAKLVGVPTLEDQRMDALLAEWEKTHG